MTKFHYESQRNYDGDVWVMKVFPCGYREFIENIGEVSFRRESDYIDALNYELENYEKD